MNFSAPRYSIDINVRTNEELFRIMRARFSQKMGFALATLNLDHLTKLPDDNAFASAYAAHDLIVADGRPIVWLSQLARDPVELIPGSDLIIPLCGLAQETGTSVALVGSSDEALSGAARALTDAVPGLEIALCHAPPFGFDPVGSQADEICDMLNDSGAGLCFIALGAPKQERFAAHAKARCDAIGFASIGAGLDFLSGHQIRAPMLMRRMALEWLWRVVQDPKRLVPRYARCFAILPGLFWRAMRQR